MTTTILEDDFTGSAADINGRTPPTTFGALNWEGGTTPNILALDGSGKAYSFEAAAPGDPPGFASVGDYTSTYGTVDDIAASAVFHTPMSIASIGDDQFAFSFDVSVGGLDVGLIVQETPGGWVAQNNYDGDIVSFTPAPDTDYTITLQITNGFQTAVLEGTGVAFVRTTAYSAPGIGLNGVGVTVGYGYTADSLEIDELVFEGDLVMPMFAVFGSGSYHGSYGDMTAPLFTLEASGTEHPGAIADLTAAYIDIVGYGGANLSITSAGFTLAAAGTVPGIGRLDITAPGFTVEASGAASEVGRFDARLPVFDLIGYGGALLDVTIGSFTLEASGTGGAVGRADIVFPLFDLEADATAGDHGGADILFPGFDAGPYATLDITAPFFTLTAIGSATVSVAYDAYRVNLKHSDPQANDQVTRYTNYPFTRIVRWKNSYFGVTPDGLYKLLEGTTDDGDAINYAIRTAISDFGSSHKKTVLSMYLGGRFSAAQVTVYVGEAYDQTYDYLVPRGPDAQNYRVKFGRGIKARYLAIGVSGSDELSVDTQEFDVLELKRRI